MRPIVTTLAFALLLAAPAAAEWSAYGSFEPDTPYDDGEVMWSAPAPAGELRVYFHGFTVSPSATPAGKPGVNPNVALLHTQIEPVASERHTAQLGIWVDCNEDGYVGLAETAAREYSAQLLLGSRCPSATGPTTSWTAGAHNYNGWVSELVPIINVGSSLDTRYYRDDDARVWADFHRPDERPFQRTCRLTTFERGTMETVGGMLNFVDCYQDLLGPWNAAVRTIGDPAGLSFSDEDDARSGSVGRLWLFGPEGSEHAAVATVDCSTPATLAVGSVRVRPPSPRLGEAASDPTQTTIAGQFNQTMEEWTDDCDASNDNGHDLYENFETDINGVNPNNKTAPNWHLAPEIVARGAAPFLVVGAGSSGTPQDAGLSIGGTRWVAESGYLNKMGPSTLRMDLESGSAGIGPAYWLTYYARVGASTAARGHLLPGAGGVYGSSFCAGQEEGIHDGWNCDPDEWWRNPDGSFHPEKARRPHVGWPYQLRDVDCQDGRVGESGVGVEPAFYGDGACPAATSG